MVPHFANKLVANDYVVLNVRLIPSPSALVYFASVYEYAPLLD